MYQSDDEVERPAILAKKPSDPGQESVDLAGKPFDSVIVDLVNDNIEIVNSPEPVLSIDETEKDQGTESESDLLLKRAGISVNSVGESNLSDEISAPSGVSQIQAQETRNKDDEIILPRPAETVEPSQTEQTPNMPTVVATGNTKSDLVSKATVEQQKSPDSGNRVSVITSFLPCETASLPKKPGSTNLETPDTFSTLTDNDSEPSRLRSFSSQNNFDNFFAKNGSEVGKVPVAKVAPQQRPETEKVLKCVKACFVGDETSDLPDRYVGLLQKPLKYGWKRRIEG